MDDKIFYACQTAELCRKGSRNVGEAEDIVILADYVKEHSARVQEVKLKKNMLVMACVRKTLTAVAESMTHMDHEEPQEFLSALIAQLNILRSGDTSSKIWNQATSSLENIYALQRIGMAPSDE